MESHTHPHQLRTCFVLCSISPAPFVILSHWILIVFPCCAMVPLWAFLSRHPREKCSVNKDCYFCFRGTRSQITLPGTPCCQSEASWLGATPVHSVKSCLRRRTDTAWASLVPRHVGSSPHVDAKAWTAMLRWALVVIWCQLAIMVDTLPVNRLFDD